jgi:hypothetical protein
MCGKEELDKAIKAAGECAEAAQLKNDTEFCARTDESANKCTEDHLAKCYNETQIR